MTIFSDVIVPQGNTLWLGSLVLAMRRFGLNARPIRTAVFRLGQDGWLAATPTGRRSYYRLTAAGRRQYAHATERIYARVAPAWDGAWTLVSVGILDAPARAELRRRLGWLGRGNLTSGVFAHPRAMPATVGETLDQLGLREQVVVGVPARNRRRHCLNGYARAAGGGGCWLNAPGCGRRAASGTVRIKPAGHQP